MDKVTAALGRPRLRAHILARVRTLDAFRLLNGVPAESNTVFVAPKGNTASRDGDALHGGTELALLSTVRSSPDYTGLAAAYIGVRDRRIAGSDVPDSARWMLTGHLSGSTTLSTN
jgi:hypothetical protein